MFIMKNEDFYEYCEFVFKILDKFNEHYNFIDDESVIKHVKELRSNPAKSGIHFHTVEWQMKVQYFLCEIISHIFYKIKFKNPKLIPEFFADDNYVNTHKDRYRYYKLFIEMIEDYNKEKEKALKEIDAEKIKLKYELENENDKLTDEIQKTKDAFEKEVKETKSKYNKVINKLKASIIIIIIVTFIFTGLSFWIIFYLLVKKKGNYSQLKEEKVQENITENIEQSVKIESNV